VTDEATAPTPDSTPEPMRLDHFLKLSGLAESGGHAKVLIQAGEVKLNGEVETRRRKKLTAGDIVEVGGERIVVPKE
jgi:ribosome-associated protein